MGNGTVVDSLVSGSVSSAFTTIIYQPLELIKTRIQLKNDQFSKYNLFGRTTRSALSIIKERGVRHLWLGTGPSLVRSVPGVGLYYATLGLLQNKFSDQYHKPDSAAQAFYFALVSRSFVSFILVPVTVVKVRYESGQYNYPSLLKALTEAYQIKGWVGVTPTIIRDSLFSGIYYMCYTKCKSLNASQDQKGSNRPLNFSYGLISGLVASIATNPVDVIKTRIQVEKLPTDTSVFKSSLEILKENHGYKRLFDGLVPRSVRRTLIASSTWTFYEILMDVLKKLET